MELDSESVLARHWRALKEQQDFRCFIFRWINLRHTTLLSVTIFPFSITLSIINSHLNSEYDRKHSMLGFAAMDPKCSLKACHVITLRSIYIAEKRIQFMRPKATLRREPMSDFSWFINDTKDNHTHHFIMLQCPFRSENMDVFIFKVCSRAVNRAVSLLNDSICVHISLKWITSYTTASLRFFVLHF